MRPYYYLGGQRGLTVLATGEPFYVDTEDRSITPWLVSAGHWEVFVDDILCALARPGDTFVDVGANMGYYSIKIGSRLGPSGRVFSFEPNPVTFGFLRDNVGVNAFEDRATLFEAALGDQQGEAWLVVKPSEPGGSHIEAASQGGDGQVRVPVMRLDDVLPDTLKADLIKIDVEGFEPLALSGMAGVLDRSPNAAVVVEMAYDLWSKFGDPAVLLARAAGGRQVFRIHHDGSLEAFPIEQLEFVLEEKLVSYLLLIPTGRLAEIARFLPGYVEPQTVAPPPPPPPPRASLLRRLIRGLIRRIRRQVS